MINKRQFFKNASMNYSAFFFNVLITFILTPFVIGKLGDSYYGYWTIIVAFTSYFGFLDFGIRAGVGQYLTRYLSVKNYKKFNNVLSTSIFCLSFVMLVGIVFSFGLSTYYGIFFSELSDNAEFSFGLLLVGIAISIKFPFVVFQAVLHSCHRFDITSFVSIFCKIVNSIAIYYVVAGGWGIVGLAIVTFFTQVLEGILMLVLAKLTVPRMEIGFSFQRETFREISNYGFFSFWSSVADQISFYISPLIIGASLGGVYVTYYSIAANLMPYLVSLVQAVTSPLMQIATSYDENFQLFTFGTKYLFWLVCFVCVNIFISGESFLGRWVGYEYISGNQYPSSGSVLKILVFGYMAFLSHSVGKQILFGKRKNKFLAYANTFCAVLVFSFAKISIHEYGILGVSFGMSVSFFVVNVIILPWYSSKIIGLSLASYLLRSILPNLIIFFITVTIFSTFFVVKIDETTWSDVFFSCLITSFIYLIISVLFYGNDLRSWLTKRKDCAL